jgi:ribosome maturation factor RimP
MTGSALSREVSQAITPVVSGLGFILEDVQVTRAGKSQIITCVVDGDSSLTLEQVAQVSREISAILDVANFLGDQPFTLEVTSPGIDRPLTERRHWEKNLTRLVVVTLIDGSAVQGRITELTDNGVRLIENIKGRMKEHNVEFADIKRAQIEVEFNRKDQSAE